MKGRVSQCLTLPCVYLTNQAHPVGVPGATLLLEGGHGTDSKGTNGGRENDVRGLPWESRGQGTFWKEQGPKQRAGVRRSQKGEERPGIETNGGRIGDSGGGGGRGQ